MNKRGVQYSAPNSPENGIKKSLKSSNFLLTLPLQDTLY